MIKINGRHKKSFKPMMDKLSDTDYKNELCTLIKTDCKIFLEQHKDKSEVIMYNEKLTMELITDETQDKYSAIVVYYDSMKELKETLNSKN